MLLGIGLQVLGWRLLEGRGGVFSLQFMLVLSETHLVFHRRGSFAARTERSLGTGRGGVGTIRMMIGESGFLGIVGFGGHGIVLRLRRPAGFGKGPCGPSLDPGRIHTRMQLAEF